MSSPYQTVWRPGWISEAGRAEAMSRAGDAAARAALDASLGRHLQDINATLDPHEQLACLVVAAAAWTVDNDLITPTFKVKRNRVEDVYAAQYETWESSGQRVIWLQA